MLERVSAVLLFSALALNACASSRAAETAHPQIGNARSPNCPDTAVLNIGGRPAYRPCSVDRPVYLRQDSPRPQVPASAPRGLKNARVMVEFVVDESGKVELQTARIVVSADPSLSDAVRAVLPDLRFTPAERDGQHVRQQVDVPFDFSS